jgi:tetratricopeptide (TPR) repeat protein
MVNQHLGMLDYATGDYHAGEARLAENVSAISPVRHQDFFGLAVPPSIISRTYRANCLTELGAFNEGISLGEEAVGLADRSNRTVDCVYAYRTLARVYVRRGDSDPAVPLLERSLQLCRAGNFANLLLGCAPPLAYLRALDGRFTDALLLLEESASSPLFMKNSLSLFPSIWMGDTYLLTGRIEDADSFAWRALDLGRRQRGRGSEAWALRLLGEIALHRDALDVAQSHYGQALTLATELGMRPLVAHCHLGLGKLSRRTGKREQARDHLTLATTMYREMDMRFWLEQAEVETMELRA